jgi:hypothetical protein
MMSLFVGSPWSVGRSEMTRRLHVNATSHPAGPSAFFRHLGLPPSQASRSCHVAMYRRRGGEVLPRGSRLSAGACGRHSGT